jgi:hypothetical protein
VTSAQQVTLAGGGGTDMRVGIRAAQALPERPGVVIMLTDGFTPWPEAPSSSRLIAALIGADPPPAPPGSRRFTLPGSPTHDAPPERARSHHRSRRRRHPAKRPSPAPHSSRGSQRRILR